MESTTTVPAAKRLTTEKLTYQQWLAGQALAGITANANWGSETDDRIAARAVRLATATIRELEEREGK